MLFLQLLFYAFGLYIRGLNQAPLENIFKKQVRWHSRKRFLLNQPEDPTSLPRTHEDHFGGGGVTPETIF